MKEKLSKEQLRWCIKIQHCKYCPKKKECRHTRTVKQQIIDNFIHIDLGGYYGSRTNKTGTSKNK